METFTVTLEIDATADQVLDALWELERWPEVAPHVRQIDMLYSDVNTQVLIMTVQTRGRVDRFKTVRIRQADRVFYFQPTPPPTLRSHHGWWICEPGEQGTRLVCRHDVDVDVTRAMPVLRALGWPARDDTEARGNLVELIGNNSLETMKALKLRLEREVRRHAVG